MERNTDTQLRNCITYFKERNIYDRLFAKMLDKYASLGRFGGSVRLTGLTETEQNQLGGFFQKNFYGHENVTISYQAMEEALQNSRFSNLTWESILTGYFGKPLTINKELKRNKEELRKNFFDGIISSFPDNPGSIWLQEVFQNRGEGYLLCTKQYEENPDNCSYVLKEFLQAVPQLPMFSQKDTKVLLPVFAAETTGNPHFYDAKTVGEQLLIAFLKTRLPDSLLHTGFPSEEKTELLYHAGILKDDLSNHTLVYGVRGRTKNNELHEGMEGFVKCREPMILTMLTIGMLEQAFPQKERIVYIVENPAVFSTLIHSWPDACVVCGNGQIRLATLLLLDQLRHHATLYYAGDFDPEGLLIAQRLKERYGTDIHLWNYDKKYYERCKSHVDIPDASLKKLDNIYLPELQKIAECLRTDGKSGYQEGMMDYYLQNRVIDKNLQQ